MLYIAKMHYHAVIDMWKLHLSFSDCDLIDTWPEYMLSASVMWHHTEAVQARFLGMLQDSGFLPSTCDTVLACGDPIVTCTVWGLRWWCYLYSVPWHVSQSATASGPLGSIHGWCRISSKVWNEGDRSTISSVHRVSVVFCCVSRFLNYVVCICNVTSHWSCSG